MHRLIPLLLALLLPGAALAQIGHGGTPPGLDPAIAPQLAPTWPVEVMPSFDLAPLEEEDLANAGRKDIPWRFGHNLPVSLGLADGQWETLADRRRVWRLGIRSTGAQSINLAFDAFVLPPGGQLFVRSADGSAVLGAFDESNNKADGRFSTDLVMADEIVLEYLEPADAPIPPELHLFRVTHGYRLPFGSEERGLGDSGACNNNVHCSPLSDGWENQIRSVALLFSNGNSFCTGSMLNNTSNDGTPYLLTANHCYSNPSNWVMRFNWESPDCNNPSSSPSYDSISSASLVARDSSSDFALVELSVAPPEDYDVYLAGWDKSGSTPTGATCIHHPSGDIKKFTVEGSQISPQGDYWEVGPWDTGTTEGGSSGSPLYNEEQRVVGQLYGGWAACDGSVPNGYTDTYGRFDSSWDGPAPDERLHDWLDPAATGVDFIDGLDLGLPPPPFDVGVSAITSPEAGAWYCSESVPAEVTLTNFGTETLVSADVQYSVDGGPWAMVSWTGSLAPGADAQVTLPDLTVVGAGVHSVEASATNPNGEVDGNSANDATDLTFEVLGAAGEVLPLVQGFGGAVFPPDGWELYDPDGEVAWDRSASVGGFDLSLGSAWFNNFDDNHTGEEDWLYSPLLDFAVAGPLVAEFNVAYTRYDSGHADRLQLMVSVDCGQTWTSEYDKESADLQTAPDHDDDFEPEPWEWRREVVALDAYAGEGTVHLAFVNTTGWGNHLYVDDVVIHGGPSDFDGDGDGYTTEAGDCDDADPAVRPGIPEVCDGLDNNCDGLLDDVDADGDDSIAQECGGPDCDDSDPDIRPGAVELCGDGVDNDCDGDIDGDDSECGGDDDDTIDDDDTLDDDDTVADDDDTVVDDDDAATDDDDTPPKAGGMTGSGGDCSCETGGGRAAPTLLVLLLGALLRRRSL